MPRPYNNLRQLMTDRGVTLDDIGRVLMVSRQQVSNKMRRVSDWKLGEVWAVMDYMGIKPREMARYFPCHGKNE